MLVLLMKIKIILLSYKKSNLIQIFGKNYRHWDSFARKFNLT